MILGKYKVLRRHSYWELWAREKLPGDGEPLKREDHEFQYGSTHKLVSYHGSLATLGDAIVEREIRDAAKNSPESGLWTNFKNDVDVRLREIQRLLEEVLG